VETAIASTRRVSGGHLLAEAVATSLLVAVIFALARTGRGSIVAPVVGAYIGAAYWFTSSTAFANPAVTVGRVFSDTFAGIAPSSAAAFVVMQLAGVVVGVGLTLALYPNVRAREDRVVAP
jgi:glycerol uptake facilitator-like aquaporin